MKLESMRKRRKTMTTLYESILKDLSEQHINKNVYPTPQQAELKLKAYSKEKTDWLYRTYIKYCIEKGILKWNVFFILLGRTVPIGRS